jgi:hypothetical protein
MDKNIINNDSDLTNYIIQLQVFCNNYNKYDLEYIKLKFNINNYSEFKSLFKQKYKKKLLFNSNKSENLFINFINFDQEYFTSNYKDDQLNKLINFFICNENVYLNRCNELSFTSKKNHIDNCNCKIKVKSIVNLDINTLLYIINNNFDVQNKKNILKIHKNDKNIKLINTFNKLEKIGHSFGIKNDIHYTLESSQISENSENLSDFEKNEDKNNKIEVSRESKMMKIPESSESSKSSKTSNNKNSSNIDHKESSNNLIKYNQEEYNDEIIHILYNKLINNIDINNNILIDDFDYINNLASNIKKIIDEKYTKNISIEFDNICNRINIINSINNTDNMNEYYNLYNDLITFKKKI